MPKVRQLIDRLSFLPQAANNFELIWQLGTYGVAARIPNTSW